MIDNANNKDFKVRLASVEEIRDYDEGVGLSKVTTATKYDEQGNDKNYDDSKENNDDDHDNESYETFDVEKALLDLITKVTW